MKFRRSCDECPLVIGCIETASIYSEAAEQYEEQIKSIEESPRRISSVMDALGIVLDERVTELTYDSMANSSDEEARAIHEEKRNSDEIYRQSEEIALSDEARTEAELVRKVQQAHIDLADASEQYATELKSKCRKGPGVVREFGIIATQYLFCRSKGQYTESTYFEATQAHERLMTNLRQAQQKLEDYYKSRKK